MNALNLSELRHGQRVRFRTAHRDNDAGTAPEWSEWYEGTLYLTRREGQLPAHLRRRARNPNVGQIIELRVEGPGTNDVGYGEEDYSPEFNEWLVEEHRLEFNPIT